jgi:SanA protein
MKSFKKILSLFYYVVLVFLVVYAINGDGFGSIFNSLKNSDEGILIKIANYFRYADTWNLIFFFMFFAAAIGLLMIFNIAYDRIFKWIVSKKPSLSFLNSQWADWTLQKGAAVGTIVFLFWVVSNIIIPVQSGKHMVDSIDQIPKPMPVLVLGTSKMLRSGNGENVYYRQRIDAAIELFKADKATFFILSGDGGNGRTDGYNETRDMKEDLIAQGVPEEKIKIDTAGFRTLDSMLRLRVLFKMNEIIIVSQAFHQPRSIFLSNFYGLKPYGYAAKGSATFAMIKREAFSSRPGMIMDLIFANMQPRVVGPGDQALEFRESFEAKSNLHILILIGLFILVFMMIMAFGVYQSKEGEARTKAVKKYVFGGSGLFVALIIMIASVYKNLDIKFVEEIVESVAQAVGVETVKMEVKKAEVEEIIKKIELAKAQTKPVFVKPLSADSIRRADSIQVIQLAELSKPKRKLFNSVIDSAALKASLVKTAELTAPPKKKKLFNSSSDEAAIATQTSEVNKPLRFFQAKIHGSQKLNNDDEVTLRTASATVINGEAIPANLTFTAKVNVFDQRIHFIVKKINDISLKAENYSNDEAGISLSKDLILNGGYLLTDGMEVRFGYQSK